MIWDGGRFVAVGYDGYIVTSSDGNLWTVRRDGPGSLNGIAFDGAQYVAVGGQESRIIATSPDLEHWTVRYSEMAGGLFGVAASGSGFVAVGNGGVALSSADGVDWIRGTIGTTRGVNAVAWAGDRFVAAAAGGILAESADGVEWTAIESGTVNSLYGVAFTGGRLLALGNAGTILRANCSLGDALAVNGPTAQRGAVAVSTRR